MSCLKVARLGHPILRKLTNPLSQRDLQQDQTQKLIDDMIETMREYDGVGLAANQVHESWQIAVLEVADNARYPRKPNVPLTVVVNPSVTALTEELEEDWEGCLSIPDLRGKVPRYKAIEVKGWDRDGKELHFEQIDPELRKERGQPRANAGVPRFAAGSSLRIEETPRREHG
jgi:peptide deformylase